MSDLVAEIGGPRRFDSRILGFFLQRIMFACIINLVIVDPAAFAGQIDFGIAAYDKGDYTTAFKIYTQLAETGNAEAQDGLGLMYNTGAGVPQDLLKSVYWFRKSAAQGWPQAAFMLGLDYDNGKGVSKDHVEAARWDRVAALHGFVYAEAILGSDYDLGDGVKQDYLQAVYWYRAAAMQGNPAGQYGLGLKYAHGLGVPQNFAYAYAMFALAAAHGPSDDPDNLYAAEISHAIKYRDELLSFLTPSEIAIGQAIAATGQPPPRLTNPLPQISKKLNNNVKSNKNFVLSNSDLEAINSNVLPCWSFDALAPTRPNFHVELLVTTDDSGTVREASVAPIDQTQMNDPIFSALATGAITAVLNYQCATLPLPREMQGKNQTFSFSFSPK